MSILVEIASTEMEAFDELQPGEYPFQILPPNDPSKAETLFVVTDDTGQPVPGPDGKPQPETRYLNWPLQVTDGPDKGRFFYHRTMVWASPDKIATADKPYQPADITLRFLDSIGFCDKDKDTGKLKLKPELFVKDAKTGKISLRLDKIYGTKFMGKLEKKPYKGKEYTNLTKSWIPKAMGKSKEEELI